MNSHEKKKKVVKQKPGAPRAQGSGTDFKQDFIVRVNELAESLCAAEQIELVHIEYQREPSGWVLRLYIDQPGGITLGNCAHISRELGDLLDIHLDTEVAYNLEVSSPGPDRPLAKKDDFERFKGCKAKIRVRQPIDGRRNFTGTLLGLAEGLVALMVDNTQVSIPYQDIARARLVNYNGEKGCL